MPTGPQRTLPRVRGGITAERAAEFVSGAKQGPTAHVYVLPNWPAVPYPRRNVHTALEGQGGGHGTMARSLCVVYMLLFASVSAPDAPVSAVAERGLSASNGGVRLWKTLGAVPDGTDPVLVVDPRALPAPSAETEAAVRVPSVPPAALRNVAPYRPPAPVAAGGGYVGCPLPNDVALLVIFRRGVWDLPKGTQDPGESIEACARREVQEEVGIESLRVVRGLGTTQHGYPDGTRYAVKTTHWYLMRTPERAFEPDRREGIRRVTRGRWAVARAHMGYDMLRQHMDRVEGTVRAALGT